MPDTYHPQLGPYQLVAGDENPSPSTRTVHSIVFPYRESDFIPLTTGILAQMELGPPATGTWPALEDNRPQYRVPVAVNLEGLFLDATLSGEGVFATPNLKTGIGLSAQLIGELQAAEPHLITWGWEAFIRGDGALTADLESVDWRAELRGEMAQTPLPDLALFVGWFANLRGEGSFVGDLAFTTFAWEANFNGEGSFAALELATSLAAAMRGELTVPAAPSLAEVPDEFAVFLRGTADLRAELFSLDDHAGWGIDGDGNLVGPTVGILYDTLGVNETLGGGNNASFTLQGLDPDPGAPVDIDLDAEDIFTGIILGTSRFYVENKATGRTAINAVGLDWHLTRYRITAVYNNVSATDIIYDIMTRVNGFDLSFVQLGLPTIDNISFKGLQLKDALSQTMDRIGGHWRVAYPNLLYAGITEVVGADPEPLTPHHPTMKNFKIDKNIGQVVNRLRVKGAGTTLVPAQPQTFPDFFSVEYNQLLGIDRNKIYPAGSTRLYVEAIEIERPNILDEFEQEFNPPKKVPPLPLFNPGGGKILIDDRFELEYHGIGKQWMPVWGWGHSWALSASSHAGGSLSELEDAETIAFVYAATFVTEFGETTRMAESNAVSLATRTIDGDSKRDGSILVEVDAITNPAVKSVNIYRMNTETGNAWSPWIRIGGVPSGGGTIVDSMDLPYVNAAEGILFDDVDEMPTKNTAERPPMPYLQLSAPLKRTLAVGWSVRVMKVIDDIPSQLAMAALITTLTRVDDGIIEDEIDDSDLGYDQLESVGQAHLAVRSTIEITPSWTSRDRNTRPGATIYISMPDLEGVFKIQTVRIDEFILAGHASPGLQFAPSYHAVASSRRFTINDLLRRVGR